MLSTSILSIATVATIVGLAVADDNNNHFQPAQRKLQASIVCMMGAETSEDVLDCCPAADEDDGVCTMIHCVNLDDMSLNDSCDCGQMKTACGQLSVYAFMLDGLEDTCAAVGKCCVADETTNEEFATCMDASGANAPNLDKFLPEGFEIGAVDMSMPLTQNDLSMSMPPLTLNDLSMSMPAPTRVSIFFCHSLTILSSKISLYIYSCHFFPLNEYSVVVNVSSAKGFNSLAM